MLPPIYWQRQQRVGLVERGVEIVVTTVFMVLMAVIGAAIVISMFLAFPIKARAAMPPQSEARIDEAQVRRDCRLDALRFCVRTIPGAVFLGRRDPTPDERDGIIRCMLEHRERLRPRCTKHFW